MSGKRAKIKALMPDLDPVDFVKFVKSYNDVLGTTNLGNLIRSNMYRVKPEGIYPSSRRKDGRAQLSTDITVMYKSRKVLAAEEAGMELEFGKDLVWEHCVPISIIQSMILQHYDELLDPEKAKEFFDLYTLVCLVTKDEDKKLRDNGLNNAMPDGWKLWDDPWVRYAIAGIEAIPQDMSRKEPQYSFLCYKLGENTTKTKIVKMTRSEIYDKTGVQFDQGIDTTTTRLEEGWVYIVKFIEDVTSC